MQSIVLSLDNGSRKSFSGNHVAIGAATDSDFCIPAMDGIYDQHASLKKIAGRWLIQSHGEWLLHVGDASPGTRHWLASGDRIRLTDRGPDITFAIEESAAGPNNTTADQGPESNDPLKQGAKRPKLAPAGTRVNLNQAPSTSEDVPSGKVPSSDSPAVPLASVMKPVATPPPPPHQEAGKREAAPKPQPRASSAPSQAAPKKKRAVAAAAPAPSPSSETPKSSRGAVSRRARERKRAEGKSVLVEVLKVAIGGFVGVSVAYYIMCMHMPNSQLLNLVAPHMPESLRPEAIRGAEIPGIEVGPEAAPHDASASE